MPAPNDAGRTFYSGRRPREAKTQRNRDDGFRFDPSTTSQFYGIYTGIEIEKRERRRDVCTLVPILGNNFRKNVFRSPRRFARNSISSVGPQNGRGAERVCEAEGSDSA